MTTTAPWRPLLIVACLAGAWLVSANPESLVTVVQRDAYRSARSSRTVDVSADGRAVAFESLARLVPADTDDHRDIYVLDRTTGNVTLESGGLGDGSDCAQPRISGDGRYVVFASLPVVLSAPRADIVLHDRVTGATRVLTEADRDDAPFRWSRDPEISEDGRVVAFSSAATALIDGPDLNGSLEDVYMVQLPAGTITRASVDSAGVQPDRGDSILPSLSADGRWLAFASTAPLDEQARVTRSDRERPIRQIYLRDTRSGTTIRLSRGLNRGLPNGNSSAPSVSADGSRVAFVSEASNLLADDENRAGDVFLYDREVDAVSWVSRAADGSSAGGDSAWPVISGNGRFIAFQSDAANLTCGRRDDTCGRGEARADDVNLLWDVFVFDRTSGRSVRVSDDELGGWMEPSVGPSLDRTGEVVAFSSRHPVSSTDRGDDFDLFVRALASSPSSTQKFP